MNSFRKYINQICIPNPWVIWITKVWYYNCNLHLSFIHSTALIFGKATILKVMNTSGRSYWSCNCSRRQKGNLVGIRKHPVWEVPMSGLLSPGCVAVNCAGILCPIPKCCTTHCGHIGTHFTLHHSQSSVTWLNTKAEHKRISTLLRAYA